MEKLFGNRWACLVAKHIDPTHSHLQTQRIKQANLGKEVAPSLLSVDIHIAQKWQWSPTTSLQTCLPHALHGA